MAEYREVLCEAYRVLKRGGLLLVHEVSKDLICAWEGMEPSDITPHMDRVGRFRYHVTNGQWFRLFHNALSRRGME